MQVVSPRDFSGPQPRTSEQGSQQGRRAAPCGHRDHCWLVCGAGRRALAFLPHVEGVHSKLGIERLCVPNSSATCSQHSPGPGSASRECGVASPCLMEPLYRLFSLMRWPSWRGWCRALKTEGVKKGGAVGIRDTWRVWG